MTSASITGAVKSTSYLVFDIESVPDPALVASVRTQGEVDPEMALEEYRAELIEQKGVDFVPYTFQVPVSIALAKVDSDYRLQDLTVLKVEDGGPERICERFWNGWRYYGFPQFVSFNGRKFDIPLLEIMAFKYGIPLSDWFTSQDVSHKSRRNRYSLSHLDLYEALTNYGASGNFVGGLNLAAKLLRKPGKIDVKGDMVLEMFREKRFEDIHRYCRCDVLDTYFVFLRYLLLSGSISREQEDGLIKDVKDFLEQNIDEPGYREYLEEWKSRENYFNTHDYFSTFTTCKK